VLEELTEGPTAMAEFCRALALAPGGEIHDARGRLEALSGAGRASVPDQAIIAMEGGLLAAERGAVSQALTSFEQARALAPSWANAEYNRGVALASLGRGQEAAAALERYLELRPDAPDALVVSQVIGRLESLALRSGPSPVMAATLGVLVPGMGHFYSGRPIGGLTVFALAGGAMAAGLFIQEVDVRCLTAVEGGQPCPEDQTVSRRHRRPNLALAIGVAGTISVLGALEAFLEARDRRATPAFREARGIELEGPTLDVRSERVDLSFFALRFR
jgi:tetratricopeptide (TPR) repeat protein